MESGSEEKRSLISIFKQLEELEPLETICMISAYRFQPPNLQKDAIIAFAIRLAASRCRGSRRPNPQELQSLLQNVGEFYKHYLSLKTPSLETFFSSQALFNDYIEGNYDQIVDSIWKRFEKHDNFLEERLGFNVANAILFATRIVSLITQKMKKARSPRVKMLTKSEYYDFAFFIQPEEPLVKAWSNAIRLSTDEIERLYPEHLILKVRKYLNFASITLKSIPAISDPLEADPLITTPIIKFQNTYLIPTPYYLLHGLPFRLHDELIKVPQYVGKYGKDKGRVLEERAHEELRLLFHSGTLLRNIKYESSGAEPDADIIVNYGDYLIFVECTTKRIPQSSKEGNLASVEDTLANSIQKCYLQALRAKRAFIDGRLKLNLGSTPSKFILMIVTDTLYPNLLSDYVLSRRFGKDSYLAHLIEDKEYPYIISISDLESIRHIADGQTFMAFLLERLNMYEKPFFLAYDEYDYFILFSKPDYKEIKERAIEAETILNYVAHLPSPVVKPRTFHVLLETIGLDEFIMLKIGDEYSKALASIAFSLLYDLYCDWNLVLKHTVFDAKGFNSLMSEYKGKGSVCRAVVWEGLYEYLNFCRRTGKDQKSSVIEHKLKDGSIGEGLNALIVIPTDIYPS